jgi:hypothetical protein
MIHLRSALKGLQPRPDSVALERAASLHRQMVELGHMYSFFDPMFTPTVPDDNGRLPPFDSGKIRMLNIDHDGGSLKIPLFTRFLRRRGSPRDCSICADSFYDVEYESVQQWLDSCQGFHGEWMWQIILFPEKLKMTCNHEIDFCTNCVQTHLETSLEMLGRSRCDQLACPSADCGRHLTYDEIRLYAKPDTFSLYVAIS